MSLSREEYEERHRVFESKALEYTRTDATTGAFVAVLILDDFEDPNEAAEEDFVTMIVPMDITLGGKFQKGFFKTLLKQGKITEEDREHIEFSFRSQILDGSTVIKELDFEEDVVCIVARVKPRPESMEIGPLDLDTTGVLVGESQETNVQLPGGHESQLFDYDSYNNAQDLGQGIFEHQDNTYDADNDFTSEQESKAHSGDSQLDLSKNLPTHTTNTASPSKQRTALQSIASSTIESQNNSISSGTDYKGLSRHQDSSEKENILETIGMPPPSHFTRPNPQHEKSHDTIESSIIETSTDATELSTNIPDGQTGGEMKEENPEESPVTRAFRKAKMEDLEIAMQTAREILLTVKESLDKAINSEKYLELQRDMVTHKKKLVETLAKSRAPRTVIGVVGDTGAGKSSVINALLEEEQLVPTSGMRACTAVVTEISYNPLTPQTPQPYRAEIEFISYDEWNGELQILYENLKSDQNKKSSGLSDEAEVAWGKLKAVYPFKFAKGEQISAYNIDEFTEDSQVNRLLGTTHEIRENNSSAFYRAIKRYVDSVTHKDNERALEYWPLIKVVRLYVRSEVLKSGAVIVDLPGVHDQNAGRAAVAERYMRQCSGYWIVAPIARAVDSKTAKTILAEAFKRQVVMDGLVENTTFICSMTDNVVNSEIYKALPDLQEQLQDDETALDKLERELADVSDKISEIYDQTEEVRTQIENLSEEIDEWQNLRERDDLTFPISLKKRKRRRDSTPPSNKRAKDSQDSDDISSDNEADDEYGSSNATKRIYSREELSHHLETLKTSRTALKAKKSDLIANRDALKSQKLDLKQQVQDKKNAISRECIKARNEWSRGRLQRNFAMGLKEADETAAELADPDNFDPENELRDYDACRRNFPVFCVSSRGYHRLRGRMKKESDNIPFNDPAQTEFPALQAHCIKVTERPRRAAALDFIVSCQNTVNALHIWITNDEDREDEGTMDERQAQSIAVDNQLTAMKEDYWALAQKAATSLQEMLDRFLYKRFEPAVRTASGAAQGSLDRWKANYKWNTFKAVCKQKGNGDIQMNQDLVEPLINALSTDWEKCFQTEVPRLLETNRQGMTKILKRFYKEVVHCIKAFGLNKRHSNLLKEQAKITEQKCGTVMSGINLTITERQRDISHNFAPEVQKVMEPGYAACVAVTGKGTYERMKTVLYEHLEANKEKMFTRCTKMVQKAMHGLEKEVLQQLQEVANEIYDNFYNDLESLGILPVGTVAEVRPKRPKGQRPAIKTEIELLLTGFIDLLRSKAEGAPDPSEAQIFQDLDKTLQSAIMMEGSQTLLNDEYTDTSRLLDSPHFIRHQYSQALKSSDASRAEGESSQDPWGPGQDSQISSQIDFTINEVVDSDFDSGEDLSQMDSQMGSQMGSQMYSR